MLRSEHSLISHVFKYRDRVAIIGDILKTVQNSRKGKRKTQIMQSANLNYHQMKKYMSYMLNCGYLMVIDGQTYTITADGFRFLRWLEAQKIRSL